MLALTLTVSAAAQQPQPEIGELFAAGGDVNSRQAGTGLNVVSGSEVSAGVAPAQLRLKRGGQVRICPRSNVNVNATRFGLMFAMSSGAMEIDYQLVQRGSDMIVTPDFSIQLAAPGRYHFALSTDNQGNACVKPLPGNTSPVQFSELMGSASQRVSPQQALLFHGGKLSDSTKLQPDDACGCPAPPPNMQAAASGPSEAQPQTQSSTTQEPIIPANRDATQPVPADHPGQVHVEVEAPFVYSAKQGTGLEPYSVAKLSFSSLPNLFFMQERVEPVVLPATPAPVSVREEPPLQAPVTAQNKAPEKKQKKGFFGRLFGHLFGR